MENSLFVARPHLGDGINHVKLPAEIGNYDNFVLRLAKPLPTKREDLLHMAVGIAGEVSELLAAYMLQDHKNIVEECGDTVFYIKGMQLQQGFPASFPSELSKELEAELAQLRLLTADLEFAGLATLVALTIAAGDLLDHAKKVWCYNKEVSEKVFIMGLGKVTRLLQEFVDIQGLNSEEIVQHNADKLLKRYEGGKYSDAAAQARVDKVEETAQEHVTFGTLREGPTGTEFGQDVEAAD